VAGCEFFSVRRRLLRHDRTLNYADPRSKRSARAARIQTHAFFRRKILAPLLCVDDGPGSVHFFGSNAWATRRRRLSGDIWEWRLGDFVWNGAGASDYATHRTESPVYLGLHPAFLRVLLLYQHDGVQRFRELKFCQMNSNGTTPPTPAEPDSAQRPRFLGEKFWPIFFI